VFTLLFDLRLCRITLLLLMTCMAVVLNVYSKMHKLLTWVLVRLGSLSSIKRDFTTAASKRNGLKKKRKYTTAESRQCPTEEMH
jgi:hypothetical protein